MHCAHSWHSTERVRIKVKVLTDRILSIGGVPDYMATTNAETQCLWRRCRRSPDSNLPRFGEPGVSCHSQSRTLYCLEWYTVTLVCPRGLVLGTTARDWICDLNGCTSRKCHWRDTRKGQVDDPKCSFCRNTFLVGCFTTGIFWPSLGKCRQVPAHRFIVKF